MSKDQAARKRDVWTPGRAFYMTAGEIEDGGVRLTGASGKPFGRKTGIVVVTSKHYNQIRQLWIEKQRKGKR